MMTHTRPGLPGITLERFAWVVVNVSDLERSRAFYEQFTPLRTYGRIEAREQRFNGLGIESGSFDGYVLRDDSPGEPCSVQLVQWHKPLPTGTTYPSHTNPGYFRMCFQRTDVASFYDDVVAAGIEPLSPLRLPYGEHITGRPVFSLRDPDGAVLEYVTLPGEHRLYHTNCNVADLQRAHEFYEGVIGLNCFIHATTHEPEDHSFGPGGDLATHDARLYRTYDGDPDGPPVFALDVVESTYPGPSGHVYAEPTNVGFARIALQVESADAAYDALRKSAAATVAGPPEIWDLGGDLGAVKTLVVKSPEGAPLELVER